MGGGGIFLGRSQLVLARHTNAYIETRMQSGLRHVLKIYPMQTTVEDKESGNTVAAVNCYFMSQDGSMFKAQVHFSPYFYLQIKVRCYTPQCTCPCHLKPPRHTSRYEVQQLYSSFIAAVFSCAPEDAADDAEEGWMATCGASTPRTSRQP